MNHLICIENYSYTKESTHTKATFKAITNGLLNRLAELTSVTEESAKISITERYPGLANALARAGVCIINFPTLKELCENAYEQKKNIK